MAKITDWRFLVFSFSNNCRRKRFLHRLNCRSKSNQTLVSMCSIRSRSTLKDKGENKHSTINFKPICQTFNASYRYIPLANARNRHVELWFHVLYSLGECKLRRQKFAKIWGVLWAIRRPRRKGQNRQIHRLPHRHPHRCHHFQSYHLDYVEMQLMKLELELSHENMKQ